MAFPSEALGQTVEEQLPSRGFNYYQWNKQGRTEAAKHITSDTREQPKPQETPELAPEYRLVCPAAGGRSLLRRAASFHGAEHLRLHAL